MSLNDIVACVFYFHVSCPSHPPFWSLTVQWNIFMILHVLIGPTKCFMSHIFLEYTCVLSTQYLDDTLKFSIHWCAAVVSSTLNVKSRKERIYFQVLFLVSILFVFLLFCGFEVMLSEQNHVFYWMPSLHNDDWLLVWVISDYLLHMLNNLYAQPLTRSNSSSHTKVSHEAF